MLNGTTIVDIPTSGGDIDIDVSGSDVIDLAQTSITVDDLVTLVARNMTAETINHITAAGATLRSRSTATQGEAITQSAHPLVLGANLLNNLTLETTGRTTLGAVGTLASELVDKNYVDTAIGNVPDITTDILATLGDPGSFRIPTSAGNDLIINWGSNAGGGDGFQITVTFDTAYPNAFLVGFATPTTIANHDGTLVATSGTLTDMVVQSSLDKASGFNYLSIGY